jgi:hypothetical protein
MSHLVLLPCDNLAWLIVYLAYGGIKCDPTLPLIEFVDLNDAVPEELSVHPNLKMNAEKKIQILKDVILKIKKNYKSIRTDIFLASKFNQ